MGLKRLFVYKYLFFCYTVKEEKGIGEKSEKMTKSKWKKQQKFIDKIAIIITVVSFIVVFAFSYFLIELNMVPMKYLTVFFMVLILIYGILYLMTLLPKVKTPFRLFACFVLLFLSVLFNFGIQYVDKTTEFVDKINEKLFQNEEYYLITLQDSTLTDLPSAHGQTIGFYRGNSKNIENAVAKLKEKILFTEEDFDDVVLMFEALNTKEVDALLINTSVKSLLEEDLSYLNLKIKELGVVLVPIETADIVKVVDVTNTPFNIYIAGGDSYGTIDKVMNTDVNMIVSVDAKRRKLLLTSIPRDYYVNLVGLNNAYDKLTHSGYYGIETSVKTVENLLDIEINYYAKINFSTVEGIINAIGGIDVYSDYNFCANGRPDICYYYGKQHLNGFRALLFARERVAFTNGDVQRVKNQQKVISAIIDKITSSTKLITNYSEILDSVSNNFSTNLDSESISRLVKMQLNDMQSWTIESQNLIGTDLFTTNTYTFPGVNLYVMQQDATSIHDSHNRIVEFLGGQ